MNNRQSGSAIVYVLIGVVLFGVLMYSISRSSNNATSLASKGRVSVQADNIIQYAKSVETGVQKVLVKGCSETEISFQVVSTDNYTNPNSPSDKHCHIFDGAGGGVTYKPPRPEWGVNNAPAAMVYQGMCGENIGTDNNCAADANVELYYFLVYIPKELCLELNRKLGVTNPNGDSPTDNWNYSVNNGAKFKGTYTVTTAGATGILSSPEMKGKTAACMKDTVGANTGDYIFYYVLLAR